LRDVAIQDASETQSHHQKALAPWRPTQTVARKRLALAAAGCVLLALTVGALLVVNQLRRMQLEVDEARRVSSDWERRYQEEQQSASLSDTKHKEREQELTGQLSELRAELEKAQQQIESASEPGQWPASLINLPVVVPKSVRSSQPSSDNTLHLSKSSGFFFISLPLEGESPERDYRATVYNARGRSILSRSGLKPVSHDSLSILLQSKFLPVGKYTVKVEDVTTPRDIRLIGNYTFEVSK
jgi:hypothetical protein